MSELSLFKAEEIFPHTWMIMYTFGIEGTTASHVRCYLVEGENYAVLIDTMCGYGDLRAFCETLTEKPIKVANTHFHGDHAGGNFHWDTCYMHWKDIPAFNNSIRNYAGIDKWMEQALTSFKEDKKVLFHKEDCRPYAPMFVEPLDDGDIFDLGGRELEVIYVGGHSKGSIAFLDRTNRCLYSGDCCNGNTLLGLWKDTVCPVQDYLDNLIHLETFRDAFDITYAGHQIIDAKVVEEGIELCAKVLAGTDAKTVFHVLGRDMTYAGDRNGEPKLFNMSYHPDYIRSEGKHQIIR